MNDRTERGVLGRMAGAGGGSGTAPRPVRALAQALVRSCEEAFALCVRIAAEREARLAPDAIGDWIDPGALLVALRMPAGAGVLALSPGALAVFTELLTTGRLRSADPATARAPTPTDAALMRRVLDRLLAATDQRLGEAGVPDWPRGMVTDGAFGDPRRLALVFGEAPPRGLRLAASFGDEGARTGTITLLLSPGRVAPARGDDPARHAGAGLWQARLEERVLGARAGIVAVLDRIAMPLAGATAMRPGDELPLRPGAAGRVRLESADGQLLAHGRLGQMQGRIALRLTELAPPPGRPAAAGPAALAAAMPTPQGSSSRFQSGAPGSARDS
ncbi:MAG: FliM/FliN family flagellar motor switch protein, partial [Rhodobacteraceae bacterium]|nr:FliM/FliN family flagellar motor switch protein [Paracoccaceae bacterium]